MVVQRSMAAKDGAWKAGDEQKLRLVSDGEDQSHPRIHTL